MEMDGNITGSHYIVISLSNILDALDVKQNNSRRKKKVANVGNTLVSRRKLDNYFTLISYS